MDKVTLTRVLWRSFFLQAAWNYQGKQNLGAAAALQPALEEIHGTGTAALQRSLTRALTQFNTQPYMAGPILGSLIKVEETAAQSDLSPETMIKYQMALTTAFAAIGDAFFWNGLLPATAVLGLLWAVQGTFWGALVFLLVYNSVHLVVRIGGFWLGYRRGLNLAGAIDRFSLPMQALRLRFFLSGLLGIFAVYALDVAAPRTWDTWELILVGVVIGPLIYLMTRLLRRRVPVEALIYGIFVIFLTWNFIKS